MLFFTLNAKIRWVLCRNLLDKTGCSYSTSAIFVARKKCSCSNWAKSGKFRYYNTTVLFINIDLFCEIVRAKNFARNEHEHTEYERTLIIETSFVAQPDINKALLNFRDYNRI